MTHPQHPAARTKSPTTRSASAAALEVTFVKKTGTLSGDGFASGNGSAVRSLSFNPASDAASADDDRSGEAENSVFCSEGVEAQPCPPPTRRFPRVECEDFISSDDNAAVTAVGPVAPILAKRGGAVLATLISAHRAAHPDSNAVDAVAEILKASLDIWPGQVAPDDVVVHPFARALLRLTPHEIAQVFRSGRLPPSSVNVTRQHAPRRLSQML